LPTLVWGRRPYRCETLVLSVSGWAMAEGVVAQAASFVLYSLIWMGTSHTMDWEPSPLHPLRAPGMLWESLPRHRHCRALGTFLESSPR
jgi:hypothetical protein